MNVSHESFVASWYRQAASISRFSKFFLPSIKADFLIAAASIQKVYITWLNLNNRREMLGPGGLLYAQGIPRSQPQVSRCGVGFQLGHAASAWNDYHLRI